MKNNFYHYPVLLKEVVKILDPKKGSKYIDATLGLGGHSKEIIKKGADVLAIEWDPEILKITKKRLALGPDCPGASCLSTYAESRVGGTNVGGYKFSVSAGFQLLRKRKNTMSHKTRCGVLLIQGNFSQIKKIAKENNFSPVDGVIFDLGISRWHYKFSKRGFSFDDNQALDMRINPRIPEKALDIINSYSYDQLYQIFTEIAQEKLAGPIAGALVRSRRLKKIDSAKELSNLIGEVYQRQKAHLKNNPATKVFLALRIAVNSEFENLKAGLSGAVEILKPGGKLLVITFNSGEDRLVKKFLKSKKQDGSAKKLELVFPTRKEIKDNRLSRSAKLRIMFKKE